MDNPEQYLAAAILLLIGSLLVAGCDYVPNHDIILIRLDSRGNLEFTRIFDEGFDDTAWTFVETSDGGYAIASGVSHKRIGISHPQVIRVFPNGTTMWRTEIPGSYGEATSIVQTAAGDFVLGTSWGEILKLDREGKILWDSPLHTDRAWAIGEAEDGSYLIPGMLYNGSNYVPVVTNIGENGTVLWQKEYGSYRHGSLVSVLGPHGRDEYIVVMDVDTSPGNDSAPSRFRTRIAGINRNGDLLWSEDLGMTPLSRPLMKEIPGGFSLLFSQNYNAGTYVIETYEMDFDDRGTVLGRHVIARAWEARWTGDGGYVFAGYPDTTNQEQLRRDQSPFSSLVSLRVVKRDAGGSRVFEKEISQPVTTMVRDLMQTRDGGYAILAERDNQ